MNRSRKKMPKLPPWQKAMISEGLEYTEKYQDDPGEWLSDEQFRILLGMAESHFRQGKPTRNEMDKKFNAMLESNRQQEQT